MLLGKNIVVTGAASGIGQRTAELAQSMGANVFSVDRNTPANPVGHFTAADLGSQDGVNALISTSSTATMSRLMRWPTSRACPAHRAKYQRLR